MAIRWDSKIEARLKSVARRYNAKVYRLRSQGAKGLPKTVSIREIRKAYSHLESKRRELLYELTELERFTRRGSEMLVKTSDGYNITKFEQKQAMRRRNRTARLISKTLDAEQQKYDQLRMLPETDKRREEMTARRSYLSELKSTLKNLLSLNFMKKTDIASASSNFNKFYSQRRLNNFYDNFFETLKKEMSIIKDEISEHDYQLLVDSLRKLSPEQLLDAYHNNPFIKSVFEYYPNKEKSMDTDTLKETVQRLIDERETIVKEYSM